MPRGRFLQFAFAGVGAFDVWLNITGCSPRLEAAKLGTAERSTPAESTRNHQSQAQSWVTTDPPNTGWETDAGGHGWGDAHGRLGGRKQGVMNGILPRRTQRVREELERY